MDLDKIFSQPAFKSIESERLELFKNFVKKIENKGVNEVFFDIVNFFNSIPKGKKLTTLERQAIIECVIQSLSKEDKEKFINILEIIDNFS